MEDKVFTSRKFLLFLLNDLVFLGLLCYCVYFKIEGLVPSILVAIATILGAYFGANVGEKSLPSIIELFGKKNKQEVP